MARALRFVIVPKIAHPWFEEVNKGAQIQAEILSRELEAIATSVYPTSKHKAVKSDPKDDVIVDCAVEGHCDYIVSGDKDLLQLVGGSVR